MLLHYLIELPLYSLFSQPITNFTSHSSHVIILFMQCYHKASDTAKVISPHPKLLKGKKEKEKEKTVG